MSKSTKDYLKKLAHQEQVNPGRNKKYDRPLRPRSAVFGSDKDYDRANNKKVIDDACQDAGICYGRGCMESSFLSKEEQLAVIEKTNPFDPDYGNHTWVRSVEDILTYEEAVQADDCSDGITPDFTGKDIADAIRSGKVIVYSSKPIINGNFVTPSAMEAASYSGTGEIYRAEVFLRDIAWIDAGQGQVATDNHIEYCSMSCLGMV